LLSKSTLPFQASKIIATNKTVENPANNPNHHCPCLDKKLPYIIFLFKELEV